MKVCSLKCPYPSFLSGNLLFHPCSPLWSLFLTFICSNFIAPVSCQPGHFHISVYICQCSLKAHGLLEVISVSKAPSYVLDHNRHSITGMNKWVNEQSSTPQDLEKLETNSILSRVLLLSKKLLLTSLKGITANQLSYAPTPCDDLFYHLKLYFSLLLILRTGSLWWTWHFYTVF